MRCFLLFVTFAAVNAAAAAWNNTWTVAEKDFIANHTALKLQGNTCQLTQGHDCAGEDLSNAPAADAGACCALCTTTPSCAAFTFNEYNAQGQRQGTCYLKTGCARPQASSSCTSGTTAAPAAPTPAPAPVPPPAPVPGGASLFCPTSSDWQVEFGSPSINGAGWTVHGGGRVGSKASFNLLGGYVEWDMDTTGAKTGVNNNFYVSSPDKNKFPSYCDINTTPGCLEMDFIENNGNCVAQATWHTENGRIGKGNCDPGGCGGTKAITASRFHMKAAFSADGWMTVTMDGDEISPNPTPNDDAKQYVHDVMASVGAQIHSSQWVGWVPSGNNCGASGALEDSSFIVSNVTVYGTVVQGQAPPKC